MDYKKALNKCMHICSNREYCINDIEERLAKWDVSKADWQIIIRHLITEKYIDNNRYVSAFINDKFKYNHWGKIKIRYQLKQKKIDESTIIKFIDTIDEQAYKEVIKYEIDKKMKSVKGKNNFEKKQKTAKYVISKGFEANNVFDIIKLANNI